MVIGGLAEECSWQVVHDSPVSLPVNWCSAHWCRLAVANYNGSRPQRRKIEISASSNILIFRCKVAPVGDS